MRSRAVLLATVLALLLLIIFGQIPGHIRLSQVVQNAAHVPAFVGISLIVLRLLGERVRASIRPWIPYLQTFAMCVLLGVGIELVQAAIGSDASIEDVLADVVGAVTGLSGAAYLETRRVSEIGGLKPWSLLLLLFVGLGIGVAPVVWAGAAYIHRKAQFPVIAAFHSPLDLYFFKQQTPPLQVGPNGSLWVQLPEGEWPGVELEEPAPDWSGFRVLVVELINPDPEPLALTLRIHDRQHNFEMHDRYNLSFKLSPQGRYRLQIPLSDIQAAPRSRRMDLSQIAGIIIFSARESAGRSFYLDQIRLE